MLLGFLTIGSAADPAPTAGGTPAAHEAGETGFIEELYRLELMPQLHPGDKCSMFSSYDRTGGNDDGFSGTYSKLRVENGNSVLADMSGPGCVHRIHFPHSFGDRPGVLGAKGEHIRFFLDGEKTPALDVSLEDLFAGKVEGFPKPLVGEGLGGHYCYVPIPYRNGCIVEVDGTDVRFYDVTYRTFPSDKGIVTFRKTPTKKQQKALAEAVKVWNACGNLRALGLNKEEETIWYLSLKAGETSEVTLPTGPAMVRAIMFRPAPPVGKPNEMPNLNGTRLEITWDSATGPAVSVPLDYFFCQAMGAAPFRSLLTGCGDEGWYNLMPMPYQHTGKITLRAKEPLEGNLTVVTAKIPKKAGDLGYFHAAYNESLPTQTGVYHPWLKRSGRGHYIGTFLATEGHHESNLPVWLEGDEQFTCDGDLTIHGTGTEDYFNCGWYAVPGRLICPGAFPLHGFTVYRKEEGKDLAAAFRWHVPDPVAYEKTMLAELEHGGVNDVNADYRSVGFYYDAAP
jgi:hypothetical protein